jgi:hypothetical protein
MLNRTRDDLMALGSFLLSVALGFIVLLLVSGCSDPSKPATYTTTMTDVTMTPARGSEPGTRKVRTLRLTGAHEVTQMVNGKKATAQIRMQDGQVTALLLFVDGVPQSFTSFHRSGRTVRGMAVTIFDSTGAEVSTSEHTVDAASALGRCLQQLLEPAQLYAATGSTLSCMTQFNSMILATASVTAATIALAATCATNPVACVIAQRAYALLVASAVNATLAYKLCMDQAAATGGTGGGGGFTDPAGDTKTTTTTGTSQGGCYTVTTTVYSLSTGKVIGTPTTETICK